MLRSIIARPSTGSILTSSSLTPAAFTATARTSIATTATAGRLGDATSSRRALTVSPASAPVNSRRYSTRTHSHTRRELPEVPSRRPLILATIAFAIASWTGFTLYATNLERLSSSAFRSCLGQVREDDRIKEMVGEVVRVDQKWYLGGKPWVKGTINMMQGRVDVSFRVKGEKGAATVYFTTFRPTQHANFENLRFFAVGDNGQRVSLLD